MGIEGYKATVRMSEEQPRWVERNVDGLVQLLQSGECHIFRAFFSLPPTEKELHL
ncbi:hypothetical protein BGW80DRAFT_1405221, partial [Lactifluus volemus]